ncbi:DUF3152 domain-containing protein [Streptomyces sp. DSM 110735]|uniref:DUF3152 domain-containing protein n=1 Tax=Streptomyces sp. DSM 110735 TaxID=2775031 RepID=UPI001F5BD42D|nr:DUF3152 domain-containing protein [Streptomyces sp. DSM 110735]
MGGDPMGAGHTPVPTPDGAPPFGTGPLGRAASRRGAGRGSEGPAARSGPPFGDGQARGGHPEVREEGGGWGVFTPPGRDGADAAPGGRRPFPRQRRTEPVPAAPPAGGSGRGPRQDYLDAFEAESGADAPRVTAPVEPVGMGAEPFELPAQRRGTKGRTFTGVAAAAVTTVLAVVVAGQVADGRADGQSRTAAEGTGEARTAAQAAPSAAPSAVPLTYEQKMSRLYPLGAKLKGSGKFDAVPGFAKAPGTGQKLTYRVDVEQGLGLDGALFADAVQKTLNDDRSWSHDGARTFERVSKGKPDFVITLASPGTTAFWCAKSGLDTTEDNVSCDSAATERVMINAYRWAQGSVTYGDAKIHAYRQMLINHEVGHRLGHGHVTCQKDGALAPVMQQQTKFLDHDGIHCLPNPWPYPTS